MDRYLRRVGLAQRLLIRLLLVLVEHGPWIFGGAPRALHPPLAAEGRLAELRRMSTSRLYFRRVSFLSLRAMLTMGYLANDGRAAIGALPCAPPSRPPARAPPQRVPVPLTTLAFA
jgi:hypothetical protein